MTVAYTTDQMLEELLIRSKGWMAVAFLGRLSIPCDHFIPEFNKLAEALDGKVRCVRIDVDENPSITDQLGVVAVPTTLLFDRGDEKARYEGPYSSEALAERFAGVMKKG